MAAADEIAIKLGIHTGDLKAAMLDAGVTFKKFKSDGEAAGDSVGSSFKKLQKGVGDLKNVLAGGGLVAVFKQVFDAAVSYAEKYRGTYDENVAATLRLRDAQQDLGSIVGKVGVGVIGVMEKFGTVVGAAVYGIDAASDALEKMDTEARKAFDAQQAKALADEVEKLAKVKRDAAVAEAQGLEKVTILTGEYIKALQDQKKLKEGSIEAVRQSIVVETRAAELRKANAEVVAKIAADEKKTSEEKKKAADDAIKKAEELTKRLALDAKNEEEFFRLSRKNAEQLTAEERERLKVLGEMKKEKKLLVEIEDLLGKVMNGTILPAEGKLLDEKLKQRDALEAQRKLKEAIAEETRTNQLAAEKLITSEMIEQARRADQAADAAAREAQIEASRTVTVDSRGMNYQDQTDASLEGVRANLKRQLDQVNAFNAQATPQNRNSFQGGLSFELAAVNRELERRALVRNVAQTLGEDKARFRFGDSSVDSALRYMQSDTKRTSIVLEKIERKLSKSPLFPEA